MTFAIYKGEKFIVEGTAEELAERFGVTPKTIRWWATPTSHKRDKGNRKTAIRLDWIEMTKTKLPDNIKLTYELGMKAYYNSETDGYYSNLADAKMAPRLEKAQASDRWIEFWNKAMADYDDTPICPSCKHLLTGLHSNSCNGFTKIVRNKAVRLFEKSEKEAS